MNERPTMNGKPVFELPAKTIINFDSGFGKKLLCDGATFSTGTACVYSCSFCYVPAAMRKLVKPLLDEIGKTHEEIVIRRKGALDALKRQLFTPEGKPRFTDHTDRRVIYASPLVDVAANMELVRETIAVCRLILMSTHWQIRLLSKSNLLPRIAQGLAEFAGARERMIYGVSTGTLDDRLAAAFEAGTALVSKRLASLHWLQDNGFRTFGMICPSLPLPQPDPTVLIRDYVGYGPFARAMHQAIRADRCEHVWAEVINLRGESFVHTHRALQEGGFPEHAEELTRITNSKHAWERYARATFEAHAPLYRPGQLRFLQYVTNDNEAYWTAQQERGAVLL